jgi:hypothetical protein
LGSETERFRDLVEKLQKYPRMYLLETRYTVLVAFLWGYDEAAGGALLDGFDEWVAQRVLGERSALTAAAVIAGKFAPDLPDGRQPASSLSDEAGEQASRELLLMLDEFLVERDGRA